MSDDIIVGYDATEGSQLALATAFDLSRQLGGKIVVVYGYREPFVGGETGDLIKTLQEEGESRVADAAKRAQDAGVEIETLVVAEAPAAALADLAEKRGARLIVVGTQGESPIRGALLGSTPHKLLHLSTVPVLVVPVPE